MDALAAEADDATAALRADQVPAASEAADEAGRGAFFEALPGHGLAQAARVMVNYAYDPAGLARSRDAYAADGAVAASSKVRSLAA